MATQTSTARSHYAGNTNVQGPTVVSEVTKVEGEESGIPKFSGDKVALLEACFRECATLHDIIQMYWDHSQSFHSIEVPVTSARECSASQKVKDLTREEFIIQGEIFRDHIYNAENEDKVFKNERKQNVSNKPFSVSNKLKEGGGNEDLPKQQDYQPLHWQSDTRKQPEFREHKEQTLTNDDGVTSNCDTRESLAAACFRHIVSRLEATATDKFGGVPDFVRK